MKNKNDIFAGTVDYKKIFQRLYSFRKTYIFLLIILLISAYLVNHFTSPVYKNSTVVYIADNEQNSLLSGAGSTMFQGMGLMGNQPIIDNEIEIIKSFTLVKKVINELDLTTTYFHSRRSNLSGLLFGNV